MMIFAPVSWGELHDKITILRIKAERLSDPTKLVNVQKELAELEKIRDEKGETPAGVQVFVEELKAINEKLWDIEDGKRSCERNKTFGPEFIELARAVYFNNDERARLKKRINELMGSAIVEEKSYAAY